VRLAARGRGRAGGRGVGGGGRLLNPLPLAGAVALAVFLAVRRRHHGRVALGGGALAVAALGLWGAGVVEPPSLTQLIEDVARRLGQWTYVVVGALAFLETGAFVGLVAPGETSVLVGGVVAGQGEISIVALIALVWACAVAGDITSYVLGRRLGREFLVRHGPKLKITEDRLEHVEAFFDRHGGPTILIGRFIGLVRALAPFVAGASRMELRRFLPYDVIGAGLWSALFCLLGYFFWRSLDRVEAYVGRGAAAFTALVVLGVAIWFAVRLRRDPAMRERLRRRLDANPLWRRVRRPLGFASRRVTPGGLGLELTTLIALAGVGLFLFFWLASLLGTLRLIPLDQQAFDVLGALYTPVAGDVVGVLTDLGSLPVTAFAVALTAVWVLRVRRGRGEGAALVVGLAVTWAVVHLSKEATDRPRPPNSHASADGFAYPSGHSAYAVALVACAIVLARGGHRLAARVGLVGIALSLAAFVGLSRIYLRVHYLSDVLGGFALGTAVFALAGITALVVGGLRHNVGR
jgi:membrane protein DedA with SNARE-associated domain/membrane-associated phospholipid phosphatase